MASTVIYNIIGGRLGRPSEELLEKMSISFDCINMNWLIAGKGSMIYVENGQEEWSGKWSGNGNLIRETDDFQVNYERSSVVQKKALRNRIYVVNQDVMAGLRVGFSQEQVETQEVVDVPWLDKGIFYLFNVRGDSMYPTLSSGDKVLAKKIEEVKEIQNGQIYVLIHTTGMLVKRLNKSCLSGGFVEYKSDNEEEYEPEKMDIKNIMGLFEVVEAITCNLGNRNKDKELVRLYKQLLIQNKIPF